VGNFKNDAQVEGHAQFFLKLEDGISASVAFSGYASNGYETTYYFTEGAAKVAGGLWINRNGEWQQQEKYEGPGAIELQLAEFCKYVRGQESEVATGEYGRNIIAVLEEVYRS